MITRYEIDRQIISRGDNSLKTELFEKGYRVHRKSKTTIVLVLWGDEIPQEVLSARAAAAEARWKEYWAKEAAFKAEVKAAARKERLAQVTISNLWRHFNRRPDAHMNLKRNSFYFTSPSGQKVRVSDHESYHFQLESERSSFSRAAEFEVPDFEFVITDFEGKTKNEVVEIIKNTIK